MISRPEVSIITTHRGDPIRLTNLLSSLERQTYPLEKVEWIVVDDASPEGAPAWFTMYEGPLQLIPLALSENYGRARARNLAIKKARGKILAFIDGDMEAGAVWLEMLVRAVRRTNGVVLGCHEAHPNLQKTAWVKYYHSRGAHKHSPMDVIHGRYYASGDSALPRVLIDQYGAFDERFSSWGGEDLEFGFRLQLEGVPFSYEPRARIVHNHYRGWEEVEKNYLTFGRDAIPLLIKLYPQLESELSLDTLRTNSNLSNRGLPRRLLLQVACTPIIYRLAKFLTTSFPRLPWPDRLFDFMVFYLYSRTFHSQLGDK